MGIHSFHNEKNWLNKCNKYLISTRNFRVKIETEEIALNWKKFREIERSNKFLNKNLNIHYNKIQYNMIF